MGLDPWDTKTVPAFKELVVQWGEGSPDNKVSMKSCSGGRMGQVRGSLEAGLAENTSVSRGD